jgi:hypothetical protein
MLDHLTRSDANQQRDIAAADAHEALRAALLPPLLRRPDAGVILDSVAHGTELRLELRLHDAAWGAFLIDAERRVIDSGTLAPDAATVDLLDVLGTALAACLNAEAEARRAEIAAQAKGLPVFAMLRIHSATETFVLRIGDSTPPVFVAQRAVEVAPEHRLRRGRRRRIEVAAGRT